MSDRIRSVLQRVSQAEGSGDERDAKLRENLRSNSIAGLEREIAAEIAYSLGRAASKLEASISQALGTLRELDAPELSVDERLALRRRFVAERTFAEQRLRDLLIQREAIGFRRHEDVYQRYVIPKLPSE